MRVSSSTSGLRLAWHAALLLVAAPTIALGQLPHAKLDWIFPPGGQRGTQVEVTIGGTDLEDGHEFFFSDSNLAAKPKRTPGNEFYPDGQVIPNQYTVSIGADIPAGPYEVQLVGRHGLSTSRVFHVASFAEVLDNANNHSIELAQTLTVGQLVNGRVDAELDDFYAIELAAGEELTCEIWSRRIDSQADVRVEFCDVNGAPLPADAKTERRDPSLSFTAPAAGKYLIRVQDVIYRGGEAFFYRMAIHRETVVRSLMPPVAVPNVEGEFTLIGERLGAGASTTADAADKRRVVKVTMPGKDVLTSQHALIVAEPWELDLDRFYYRFPEIGNLVNDVAISFTSSSAITQQPATDQEAPLPRIGVPGELVGNFGPQRNVQMVELQSDAAGEVVIEVFSQRLGEPADPHLTISRVVKNAAGQETLEQVAEADRDEERTATPGYSTQSEDPYIRVNLEKDAIYRISVRDQNLFSHSRQDHAFRLVVRHPQPDFHLLLAPASPFAADPAIPLRWPLTLRAGDALAIPIIAVRQDGFAGDIVVTADGLPPGVHCQPTTIRAGKAIGQLVLSSDENVSEWVGGIRIVAEAQIGESKVQKTAKPATLIWDTTTANFFRARLNHQLAIAVIREAAPVSVRFNETSWESNPGGQVKVKMATTSRAELKEALSLAPIGLPEGVTAKFVAAEDKKSAEFEIVVGEKTPPGVYDFLLSGKPLVSYQNNPEAAAAANEDQARITSLLGGFKSKREQMVAAAGAAPDASSPEIKQLDEQIARGEVALKEATERATKLATAAQPAERRAYVVSNIGTLHVKEIPKQ